jgi:hypothetical protein
MNKYEKVKMLQEKINASCSYAEINKLNKRKAKFENKIDEEVAREMQEMEESEND